MKLKISVHLEVRLAFSHQILFQGHYEGTLSQDALLKAHNIGVIESLMSCWIIIAVDTVDPQLAKHP